MDEERGNAATAGVEERERLSVAVRTAGGKSHAGEILDGNADYVETLFAQPGAPVLVLGQPATLTFLSTHREPCEVRATTYFRNEMAGFRRYSFQFDESEALRPQLVRMFNQRRAFRVEPDPHAPVNVTMVSPSGFQATGCLEKISSIGIGFTTSAQADTGFASIERAEVRVALPPDRKPLRLVAWIRNRHLLDKMIQYGLEFDPHETEHFTEQEQEILIYVMLRQRDLLRSRLH